MGNKVTNNDEKSIYNNILDGLQKIAVIATKNVLNREEAALFMGIAPKTLANLTSKGEIAYYKNKGGKLTYYNKQDLLDYMCNKRMESTAALRSEAFARVFINQ